jgi:hypothetical protein
VWAFVFTLVWGLFLVFAQALLARSVLWIVGVVVVAVIAFAFAYVSWGRLGRRWER